MPDDFCSGADLNTEKYLYADMPGANAWIDCNNRRAAGESCSIGTDCSSGSCMGGYCCGYSETEQCSSPAPAAGAAMAGEECSSTADCYNDAACLGGRCCSMSQSQYADVETARYSECTACADSTHDKPGTCVACGTGYHVVTGEETDADIDSLYYLGICTTTIRAATHRNTTLPNTTPVTPRQPRVVRAARRNLIGAHLGCAVTIFAATKLLRTVVAHLLVILGLAPVAQGSWQARSAAALRTATTTRRALVVAAARCRSLNMQTLKPQDTASAPRAQTAPTTSPELAWPAAQGIMWSRARRLTQTSTACTISAYARPLSVQRRIAILHYPIRHLLRQDNPGWCVQLVAILSVLIWAVQ